MTDRINKNLPMSGAKSKMIQALKPLFLHVENYWSVRTSSVSTSNKIMAAVAGCVLVLATGVALSMSTTAAGSPVYTPDEFDQERANDRFDENLDILSMASDRANPSFEAKRAADRLDENRDILAMSAGVANEAQRATDRFDENLDIVLRMQSKMVSPSVEAQRAADRHEENLDILESRQFVR